MYEIIEVHFIHFLLTQKKSNCEFLKNTFKNSVSEHERKKRIKSY